MTTLICTKTWGTCRKAVALLKEKNIEFDYREYKKNPLGIDEIRTVLHLLSIPARELLRTREKAYKELQLTGTEEDEILISHFANYPGLLQRPIFIHKGKAVVCRPLDRILELL